MIIKNRPSVFYYKERVLSLMKQEEKSSLTRRKILETAGALFIEKGFEATTMQDIMSASRLSKGAIYHHFKSKDDIMQALGDQMFFENNPFDGVKGRTDLNGLEKIREVLRLSRSDKKRDDINIQAVSILKDPRILAMALESNRRILTPLWFDLLEEGGRDGSIETEYAKELSELLPLINFWLIPSVFPDTAGDICHKFQFIMEVLTKMGLPLMDNEMMEQTEKYLAALSLK